MPNIIQDKPKLVTLDLTLLKSSRRPNSMSHTTTLMLLCFMLCCNYTCGWLLLFCTVFIIRLFVYKRCHCSFTLLISSHNPCFTPTECSIFIIVTVLSLFALLFFPMYQYPPKNPRKTTGNCFLSTLFLLVYCQIDW